MIDEFMSGSFIEGKTLFLSSHKPYYYYFSSSELRFLRTY